MLHCVSILLLIQLHVLLDRPNHLFCGVFHLYVHSNAIHWQIYCGAIAAPLWPTAIPQPVLLRLCASPDPLQNLPVASACARRCQSSSKPVPIQFQGTWHHRVTNISPLSHDTIARLGRSLGRGCSHELDGDMGFRGVPTAPWTRPQKISRRTVQHVQYWVSHCSPLRHSQPLAEQHSHVRKV